jgi:hypothetical protein
MSGGAFDYDCFKISQFADDLINKIRNNNVKNSSDYAPNYSIETILLLKQCSKIIQDAGEIAKHVEWLYSGDDGEETFKEHVMPILNKKDLE